MASKELKGLLVLILPITAFITACTPLQQAPLVYSSKVVVGVDISSPTAEQPGASVNIGYKLVDIAYVPVAVAKPCEKLDKDNPKVSVEGCADDIYKIFPISGSSTKDNQASSNQNADDALKLKKEIADLNADVTKLKADIELRKERAEEEKLQLDTAKTKLEKAVAESDKSKPISPTVSILQQKSTTLATSAATSESEIIDKEKSIALKTAELEKKRIDLSKLEDRQNDSYSVFGSFDSATKSKVDTKEKSINANVSLGKVFSTGIAAQNLTQGLRDQFANSSLSTCMLSAQNIINDYKETMKLTSNSSDTEKLAYSKFSELALGACTVRKKE